MNKGIEIARKWSDHADDLAFGTLAIECKENCVIDADRAEFFLKGKNKFKELVIEQIDREIRYLERFSDTHSKIYALNDLKSKIDILAPEIKGEI